MSRANLATVESVDPQALRELVDSQEHPDYLESRDTEVTQVLMVLKESLELLEQKVNPALLEKVELLDRWVREVCLVNGGVQDRQELLVLVVMTVCLAVLVHRVPLVQQDLPGSQDPPVQRVKRDQPEPEGLREHRGPVESLVFLEPRDPLESLVTLVLTGCLEPKDQWALRVSVELLVSRVRVVLQALRERQVL